MFGHTALEENVRHAREGGEQKSVRADAFERAVTAEQESNGLKLRLEEIEQALSLKIAEGDQARERGEGLARELDAAQARLEAKEKELGALRSELEGVRGELAQTRTAAEGAQADLERKLADVRKRIVELEAQNAKHEERIVKAYQKIKGDEKVKDKVRKAIAIAAQLLEEGLPAEPAAAPAEKSKVS